MFFFLTIHILSCLWVLMAWLKNDILHTWLAEDLDQPEIQIYLTSLYFTISTISTVGYGDISAND